MLLAFLIGVGTVCAITTFLAVLMIIADATIANYGDVTITVNDEKKFESTGGKPLLSALKENEIFIPSACGGRGSCGLCKVKVTSGAGDVLPTELPWLTDEEKEEQVRLSCQLKVKRDVSIYVPEELLNVKEYTTQVRSIRDLTPDTKEIVLELVEPAEIEFRAGQFIQFEVPPYELTDEPVYRAYSIASPPSHKDQLELQIRLVPYGICTTYIFKYLKQGDTVTVNGPYGDFYLRDSSRDIVFIAGGTGMAPIKSILHDMAEKENDRKAEYFYGARTAQDLLSVEEMEELEGALPNFRFVPALSEPLPDDNWTGETGLITDVVNRHVQSGHNLEAYLCGSPAMIDACIEVLSAKGVPADLIFYDKFT